MSETPVLVDPQERVAKRIERKELRTTIEQNNEIDTWQHIADRDKTKAAAGSGKVEAMKDSRRYVKSAYNLGQEAMKIADTDGETTHSVTFVGAVSGHTPKSASLEHDFDRNTVRTRQAKGGVEEAAVKQTGEAVLVTNIPGSGVTTERWDDRGLTGIKRTDNTTGEVVYKNVAGVALTAAVNKKAANEVIGAASADVAAATESFQNQVAQAQRR